MADPIQIQITRHDDLVVVHLPTELLESDEIRDYFPALIELIEREKPLKLLVSFQHVKSFGSESIGSLIRIQRRVKEYGGQFRLCGMSKRIRHLFQICFPNNEVFTIHDSCGEAGEALE
ncbi:MAG: STAS domain-containing protein [Pirellulaceae bacterium]|nr:STAS domain-containing protein [Pirellulaceae bacterium]